MQETNKENDIKIMINRFGPILDEHLLKGMQENELLRINLENFFDRPFSSLGEDILNRYIEITNQETHIIMTPAYKATIERFIDPLVSAKRHYCTGDYLSCIALSGLIGEMLTLLAWKITDIKFNGNLLDGDGERVLFGQKFDDKKMGQERRIKLLKALKIVSQNTFENLYSLLRIRNAAMHSWERKNTQMKGGAKKAIVSALKLFKVIMKTELSIDEKGGQTISINPRVLKFIKSESGK